MEGTGKSYDRFDHRGWRGLGVPQRLPEGSGEAGWCADGFASDTLVAIDERADAILGPDFPRERAKREPVEGFLTWRPK